MKGTFRLLRVLVLVTAMLGISATADDYSLDWWTIDGGGTPWTTGADYELFGTIAQPDAPAAPVMVGGDYELTGGFWPATVPQFAPGDLNCDGVVNNQDIDGFILALFNPTGYAQQYPNCNILNGDMNADGVVNNQDIDGFVARLFGG